MRGVLAFVCDRLVPSLIQTTDEIANLLAAREGLFAMWSTGVSDPAVHAYIASMADYGFDMWSRAGREIERAFAAVPVPLAALINLIPKIERPLLSQAEIEQETRKLRGY